MKRHVLLALVWGLTFWSGAFAAQEAYPQRQVRWIVPYVAGGGSDFLARTIAQAMAEQSGQAVIVDNRPGGGTAIGAVAAARATPDGYTIFSADNGTLIFNPVLYRKLTYDVKDFAPVTLMGRYPMVLVLGPSSQAKDFKAFMDEIKGSGQELNYASVGAGSPHHLAMELFLKEARVKMKHIPYRGAPPALSDVVGGQIPAMMIDMNSGGAFIKSGKVRPIAVASAERLVQLPNVPTFAELGLPGVVASALVGLSVPSATPAETIQNINRAVVAAIKRPEVQKRLIEFGAQPVGSTTEEWRDLLQKEAQHWQPMIRELGITLE